MAKHHPDLDFSTLDMKVVEQEILTNHALTGVAADQVNDGTKGTVVTIEPLVDLSPSNLPWKAENLLLFLAFEKQFLRLICFEQVYIFLLLVSKKQSLGPNRFEHVYCLCFSNILFHVWTFWLYIFNCLILGMWPCANDDCILLICHASITFYDDLVMHWQLFGHDCHVLMTMSLCIIDASTTVSLRIHNSFGHDDLVIDS